MSQSASLIANTAVVIIPARDFPAEIIERFIKCFNFNYKRDATDEEGKERFKTLNELCCVNLRWKKEAERYLFRCLRLKNFDGFNLEKTEWPHNTVELLELRFAPMNGSQEKQKDGLYRLLSQIPNLESLVLKDIAIGGFSKVNSDAMRSTKMLPKLKAINIDGSINRLSSDPLSPEKYIFFEGIFSDIIATASIVTISTSNTKTVACNRTPYRLDFGGKLKYLNLDLRSSICLFSVNTDPAEIWIGVEQLHCPGGMEGSDPKAVEFRRVVYPTLKKLKVRNDDEATWSDSAALLVNLEKLAIAEVSTPDMLPPFHTFSKLTHLAIIKSSMIHILFGWQSDHHLLPPALNHLHLECLPLFYLVGLPPIKTLSSSHTSWHDVMGGFSTIQPTTTQGFNFECFKFYTDEVLGEREINLLKTTCQRLEVTLKILPASQYIKDW